MSIEDKIKKMCTQTAVYWGTPVSDGYGGFTYNDPIEINCRWEDKKQLVQKDDGREIMSVAQVFVTQDLVEQGYLYLGSLDDSNIDSASVPTDLQYCFEILQFEKIPALNKTNEFIRKAYLTWRQG